MEEAALAAAAAAAVVVVVVATVDGFAKLKFFGQKRKAALERLSLWVRKTREMGVSQPLETLGVLLCRCCRRKPTPFVVLIFFFKHVVCVYVCVCVCERERECVFEVLLVCSFVITFNM